MKNKFIKKICALTLSLTTAISIPGHTFAGKLDIKNPFNKTQQFQKIKEYTKKHAWQIALPFGALFSLFLGLGARPAGKFLINEINSLLYFISEPISRDKYKKNFKNCSDSTYTKRQEGVGWCWAACIEGLFRYHDVEDVNQEEIVKTVLNLEKLPKHEFNRHHELLSFEENITSVIKSITDKFSEKNLKFKAAIFPLKNINQKENNIYQINNAINSKEKLKIALIHYYNGIGKSPFTIMADAYNLSLGSGHAVNIISIDEDNIKIEDPAVPIYYSHKTDDYLEKYISDSNCSKLVNIYTIGLVKAICSLSSATPDLAVYYQDITGNIILI